MDASPLGWRPSMHYVVFRAIWTAVIPFSLFTGTRNTTLNCASALTWPLYSARLPSCWK